MNTDLILPESIEYIEFAVQDLKKYCELYESLGFKCVGKRTENQKKSFLYQQGTARFVISASSSEKNPIFQFTKKHGNGVCTIGLKIDDATKSNQIALQKGLITSGVKPITSPSTDLHAQCWTMKIFGDVNHEFLSYANSQTQLNDFFPEEKCTPDLKGKFLQNIDHVTVNVAKGEVDSLAKFYQDVFGFYEVRYFDIRTEKTGLFSRAIRSQSGRVTMPFNEPTDPKSQIQEFLNTFNGPGVQHIALHTSNILLCLKDYIQKGLQFLSVPDTYYEALIKRLPLLTEDTQELQQLKILADGDDKGYLLQIFTQNIIGPFFFEFIQRKGHDGFGEGNFRALFEAIEQDQIKRGFL